MTNEEAYKVNERLADEIINTRLDVPCTKENISYLACCLQKLESRNNIFN
jgi:hypothetical protein